MSSLLSSDEYMLLADYQSYVDCQDQISAAYKDQERSTDSLEFDVPAA